MPHVAELVADLPPASHATFHVERVYRQPPAKVFRAFADQDMVRRWRVESDGCEVHEFSSDFRIGGHEVSRFSFGGGPEIRIDAEFQDIVPDRRLAFVYRMGISANPFSASLTTIELLPSGSGTRLTYTEQLTLFDGTDSVQGREEGCRLLMESLAVELDRQG